MDASNMEAMLDSMAASFALSFYAFYYLVAFATYILTSLSLFTIARRRFLRGAWLAWVPFAQFWVLGSIADDYQWSAWYRNKKKRIVLLVLFVLLMICELLTTIGFVRIVQALADTGISSMVHFENFLSNLESGWIEPYRNLLMELVPNIQLIFWSMLVMFPLVVVYMVFYYMALYDLYRSCNPDNATVFLVLSILFGITMPIFLMVCRKQDRGLHYTF